MLTRKLSAIGKSSQQLTNQSSPSPALVAIVTRRRLVPTQSASTKDSSNGMLEQDRGVGTQTSGIKARAERMKLDV